ncbi:helix-turn-helix transcriptional regulator [Paenibacillus roseipurpureus]|uniref:AraC family transcriptional regulator n=1 Tax=Paenibacillus roseopurpureus TaxID=2918901 RepID=A0AA96RMA2_9BACL|nr:AraC family transcriptional regulator [Paenibacillus sp. MBLB1832]WNR46251.1 AraC family transcriptional regulator [Paenibacillus sp. MBLB1832]
MNLNDMKPNVHYVNRLVCSGNEIFGPRYIEDHQFIFVDKGRGTVNIQGQEYDAMPGQLFYYGPGEPHRFQADSHDPFILYGLHFLPNSGVGKKSVWGIHPAGDLQALYTIEDAQPRILDIPVSCKPGAWLRPLFEEAVYEYRKGDQAAQAILQGLVLLLVGRLFRQMQLSFEESSPHHAFIKKIRLFLEDHAEESYEVGWLEDQSPYGHDYVSRMFKRVYGVSPHIYHARRKLDLAGKLLQETDQTITKIAERLHFSSIHYFSRGFKAYTGEQPSQYRARRRRL